MEENRIRTWRSWRPFDYAQDMLQAKRRFVMPALRPRSGYTAAGIQVTEASVIPLENGIQFKGMDPGFHRGDDMGRNDGKEKRLPVDVIRTPRLRAEGCSVSEFFLSLVR